LDSPCFFSTSRIHRLGPHWARPKPCCHLPCPPYENGDKIENPGDPRRSNLPFVAMDFEDSDVPVLILALSDRSYRADPTPSLPHRLSRLKVR